MFSEVKSEFEHDTMEAATKAAFDDAAATGGRVFPCVVSRQGSRVTITTAFPMAFIGKHVRADSVVKGSNPLHHTNRPLMPEHVRTIYNYLKSNPDRYLLPPVTLNVRKMPQVHVIRTNAAVRAGYMIIADETMFYVTDGQHRIAAIAGHHAGKTFTPGIIDEKEDMGNNAVSVLIIIEPEMAQIHQDFADAAQTKQIPASLLAAYNMREPINRVLSRIVEETPLFKGRIDATSKTLPKASPAMFLLNQVRGLLKELLAGDYALSDEQLSRIAAQRLGAPSQQDKFMAETLTLLSVLSQKMEPWMRIADIPTDGTGGSQIIPNLRQKYLNMTASGLVIIGRVAYEINKDPGDSQKLLQYDRLATRINWRRDADIWRGNVVADGGRLVTLRTAINRAAEAAKRELRLAGDGTGLFAAEFTNE